MKQQTLTQHSITESLIVRSILLYYIDIILGPPTPSLLPVLLPKMYTVCQANVSWDFVYIQHYTTSAHP